MLMACCQAFAQEKPTTTNEEKALSPCTDLLIDSSFKTATRQPAACETSQVQKIQQEDQEKHTLAADQTPVADTYYYRIGDGQWKLSAVTGGMKAEGLRPSDFFVLTAAGSKCVSPDGTVAGTPCSLKALFVKIIYAGADPGTEDEEWHKLLEWKPDQEKLLQSSVIQNLDEEFFVRNPRVRITINGKGPIVEEAATPSDEQIAAAQRDRQMLHQEQLTVQQLGYLLEDDYLRRTGQQKARTWARWTPGFASDMYVAIYRIPDGCRYYDSNKALLDSIRIPAPLVPPSRGPDNGITVGNPKLFDTFTLRQKIATTASQLATINPFSQAQITAQFGSFQGITRDQSFIAAQVTTSPTPGVVNTQTQATGNTVTTANAPVQGIGTVTTSCPAGYVPTLGGQGAVSCTLPLGTATGPVTVATTNGNPTTPESVTTATQPTSQIVTTTPSLQGSVPTAPTLNPLTPPTNVGVSASEMLSEQTQLSSELTTLQTLLQGAVSDQLLLSNRRAIGLRAQTTIGFPVSIETPSRLKGTVAEFRVLVLPIRQQLTSQPVSIVNLLPSEKTYNVARVTSNAKQFGLGVALQPVSLGITAGKSKDRLFLAKEADTLALQYPAAGYSGFPYAWYDADFDSNNSDCGPLPPAVSTKSANNPTAYDFKSGAMFGWQFRPVLGAAAVSAGRRTVFAQLALPESDGVKFDAEVWVQTRWRSYDQKNQLAGRVYPDSCHWERVSDPLVFDNPVTVENVQVADEGQGMIRFRANGEFFSSTGQMRSGSVNVGPTYFDGYSIEYFGLAKDVLSNGDLQLLDEAMHGQSLVIRENPGASCRIKNPRLSALPLADGNSVMRLEYDRPNYVASVEKDGPQHPLLLIGTDVYGLRDKPLQAAAPRALSDSACLTTTIASKYNTHCAFRFIASTDSINSARNFLVRDPAWDAQGVTGPIEIDPTFTKLEASAKSNSDASGSGDESIPGCPDQLTCAQKKAKQQTDKANAKKVAEKPTWFLLSGTNLSALEWAEPLVDDFPAYYCGLEIGCLQILADEDDGPRHVSLVDIKVVSNSEAWVKLPKNITGIHVFWSRDDRPASEWDLAIKKDDPAGVTAKPALLYETDSQAVTFSGADFSKVTNVIFETTNLTLIGTPSKSNLVVQVTSAVTAKYGHKELIAQAGLDDKGKPKIIALPLDVVKH
jgi:hypothetical protein